MAHEQTLIVLYVALAIFLVVAWRYGFRQYKRDRESKGKI